MPTNDTTSARETHFLGFAKLLWQKYVDIDASWFDRVPDATFEQEVLTAFAQAAYDFAQHVLQHVNWYDPEISEIPDMPEWKGRNNANETQQSTP